MSDSKANAYVSSIITKVQKMVSEAKRLERIAIEFRKKKEAERARIEKLKKQGVKITDAMVMPSIRLAFSEDDAWGEVLKVKNSFHKIELDVYNKRQFISGAAGQLTSKLKKVLDDAERYFQNFNGLTDLP